MTWYGAKTGDYCSESEHQTPAPQHNPCSPPSLVGSWPRMFVHASGVNGECDAMTCWDIMTRPVRSNALMWCTFFSPFSRPCSPLFACLISPFTHLGAFLNDKNSKKQKRTKKRKMYSSRWCILNVSDKQEHIHPIPLPVPWTRSSPAPPSFWEASVSPNFGSLSFRTPSVSPPP